MKLVVSTLACDHCAAHHSHLSISHSAFLCVPGLYFPYSKRNQHPRQRSLLETETFVNSIKINNPFFKMFLELL